jgi:hypothetical protein
MYQECGSTSITSTHPRFEWTQKNARQLRDFETTSTCPLENAMCAIVDKKETPDTTCLPILDIALSTGHVDAVPQTPTSSCDNPRPLESASSGRDGHFSDEVTR